VKIIENNKKLLRELSLEIEAFNKDKEEDCDDSDGSSDEDTNDVIPSEPS
jgi:hypothetical protein